MKKINSDQFDEYKKTNNLTGCLTIVDSEIINFSLYADIFFCEDTVNFIRSNGTVEKINISNANHDAIDADFSKLEFNDVEVNNAKNDCLDLSFGVYKANNIILNKCGDKGVSVGERSNFSSNNLYIENSNTGISSKDGSITTIDKINISNVSTCISSYNKKQEFNGGNILLNNFNCEFYEKKIYKDKYSKITRLN